MIHETGKLGEATYSDDWRYRYSLTRHFDNANPSWWVTFVMLNPSTATHDENDRTIAKCMKYARRFHAEHVGRMVAGQVPGWQQQELGVRIVNLYAFRATDPDDCFAEPKPVGGELNDFAIADACDGAALVVCAWGTDPRSRRRASEVRWMLVGRGALLNRIGPPARDGSPKHPLYLKDDLPLEVWR